MKPYQYQKEVIREIESFDGRSLVALDAGLGKTAISLWWLQRHADKAFPAVVVCPASVKYQWERETFNVIGLRACVLEGQKPNGKPHGKLIIINYDILRFWVEWLRKFNPQTVIADENFFVANPQTKRTKALRRLIHGVPHLLGLSGTPLVNRPIELFPILNMLAPKQFSNRFSFGIHFCAGKKTFWGWEFKGATRTKELNELLTRNLMSRRQKREVLKDLPELSRRVIPLPMRHPEEYHKADSDFIQWLREQDITKAQRASNAEGLVKAGTLLRLAARLKLKYVIEWVNDFLNNSDEKLIVFAIHRKMIEALHRRCSGNPIVIDGRITGRKRDLAVTQFRNDRRTRLLIGQVKAMGIGVDRLQHVANNAVFVELPWQPGAIIQAEGRLDRIGQEMPISIYYLVAVDSIEEKLCQLLQQKQSTLTSVLDGGEGEELSLFNELMRELSKENKLCLAQPNS